MENTKVTLPDFKLVGITIRTNNVCEMDPNKAKISTHIQQYFHDKTAEKILNRKNPGVTFCMFTDYESDASGDYTYFIGEEVSALDPRTLGLATYVVPPQLYAKFTPGPGPMPDILITAWQKIWWMSEIDLGGKRRYHADFEIYDERARDPQNTVFDLYIGIEN